MKPELLDDLLWILQDPERRAALHRAWEELQRGRLIRPEDKAELNVRSLHVLVQEFGSLS